MVIVCVSVCVGYTWNGCNPSPFFPFHSNTCVITFIEAPKNCDSITNTMPLLWAQTVLHGAAGGRPSLDSPNSGVRSSY